MREHRMGRIGDLGAVMCIVCKVVRLFGHLESFD